MIRYECDKCGARIGPNDPHRYIVRVEVFAASGHVDLDRDATKDTQRAMDRVLKHLARANPDEIEDQTYRMLRFDVCDACRRELLAKPLG